MSCKRLKLETETPAVRQFDESVLDVDRQFDARMLQQVLMLAFAQHDGEHAVLQRIAAEDVGDFARQHCANAEVEQRPRRMLTRRTTAEIAPRNKDLATFCLRLVQGKLGI